MSFPSPRSSAPEPVKYVARSGDMRHTEYGPLGLRDKFLVCHQMNRMNPMLVLSDDNSLTPNFLVHPMTNITAV